MGLGKRNWPDCIQILIVCWPLKTLKCWEGKAHRQTHCPVSSDVAVTTYSKYPLYLVDFYKTGVFSNKLSKRLICQVSWKVIQRKPSCSMWIDRRRDRQDEANNRFSLLVWTGLNICPSVTVLTLYPTQISTSCDPSHRGDSRTTNTWPKT
jgi:hypothetical protein